MIAILLAALSLGFLACSTIESLGGGSLKRQAKGKGAMLSAAGFRIIPAQTPDQVNDLRSLPALKLNYYVGRGGQLHYWMADPYNCMCLFDGKEKAYLAYLEIKRKLEASEQEKEASEAQLAFAQEEEMNLMSPFWFVPGAMFPVFATAPEGFDRMHPGGGRAGGGRGVLGGGPGHGGLGHGGGFGHGGFGGGIGGGFGGGHGGR